MKAKYLCPHCKKVINVGDDIFFVGKNNKGENGLISLHTELGNYSSKRSEDFHIEKGEVDLFCPLCSESINYEFKISYANLIKVEEGEHIIIFSKKYGEKRTFKVEGKKVTTYGEHAFKFTDPEWFL